MSGPQSLKNWETLNEGGAFGALLTNLPKDFNC